METSLFGGQKETNHVLQNPFDSDLCILAQKRAFHQHPQSGDGEDDYLNKHAFRNAYICLSGVYY